MVLTLTRIFLHNWHRFTHHVIDVEDSLYLAGHNGSGKSSILDALQVVLVADRGHMRFNSAAHERSRRTLETYVHGTIGEDRQLRPGATVAYVAVEFRDRAAGTYVTLAVCMEAGAGHATERLFAILPEPLDPDFLTPAGQPLTRRALKAAVQARQGGRTYDAIGEYQTDMLARLGGLNERFFDLFLRALTFQPIANITDFVEKWLLRAEPLQLDVLQQVVENFQHLRARAAEVREKLGTLDQIAGHQLEMRRLRALRDQYLLLGALLQFEIAERRLAESRGQVDRAAEQLIAADRELDEVRVARKGAEEALDMVRRELYGSDVRRRRDDLQEEVRKTNIAARTIQERWRTLAVTLGDTAHRLRPLLECGALDGQEQSEVNAFIERASNLNAAIAPPLGLHTLIEVALPALQSAEERSRREEAKLNEQLSALHEREAERRRTLETLRRNGRAISSDIERVRDLLVNLVGERPPLLCELLEVPNEEWQDAVEALLDRRRFALVVPREHLEAAIRILEHLRTTEGIFDVRLLDIVGVGAVPRSARIGSLASQISARRPDIQAFIDAILGDVIACDSTEELRGYERAVTRTVMVRDAWTIHVSAPDSYRPWHVGQRATRSQIEACERELAEISRSLAEVESRNRLLKDRLSRFVGGRNLLGLRERLDQELDASSALARTAELQAQLAALETGQVERLETEARRLQALTRQAQRQADEALRLQEQATTTLATLRERMRDASLDREGRRVELEGLRARYTDAVAGAEVLFEDRRLQPDLSEPMRNAERAMRQFETQAGNALDAFKATAQRYNIVHQFAGRPDEPEDDRYAHERTRLQETDLPRYEAEIHTAQRAAEDELREHVLHELRRRILLAQEELQRINAALSRLEFHDERYRFTYEAADDVEEFYRLIVDSQLHLVGNGSLFTSTFYEEHKEGFDRFYEALTRTPRTDVERAEQERLTDYRRYLTYDIKVTHPDGRESRLSKLMGHTSGGEAQTPFYVTIAASFLQLYSPDSRRRRSAIRLVAFDEAFSKMDQDRIGATLDLFRRFGLQVITATPLERCEYLVPKMCTNLVLTAVGDTVLVEPYRNYLARIEQDDGG